MSTKRLSIIELHREIQERHIKRNASYDKILTQIVKRIQNYAKKDKLNCTFEIPEYIFGYALFQLDICIQYVYTELTSDGYLVKYYFPNMLYISWDFDEIEYENKMENKIRQIPYYQKPTLPEYKKQTKLPIYDPNVKFIKENNEDKDENNRSINLRPEIPITPRFQNDFDRPEQYNNSNGFNGSLLPFLQSDITNKKKVDVFSAMNMKPGGKMELNLF